MPLVARFSSKATCGLLLEGRWANEDWYPLRHDAERVLKLIDIHEVFVLSLPRNHGRFTAQYLNPVNGTVLRTSSAIV